MPPTVRPPLLRRGAAALVVAALGAFAATGPAGAVAAPTHDLTVTGTVVHLVRDSPTSWPGAEQRDAFLVDVDGTLVTVPPALHDGLQRSQPVRVTLTAPVGVDAGEAVTRAGFALDDVRVSGVVPDGPLPPLAVPASPDGTHTLTVLPLAWSPVQITGFDTRALTLDAREAAAFWGTTSGGRMTMTAEVRTRVVAAGTPTCDPAVLYNRALEAHGSVPAADPRRHVAVHTPTCWERWTALGGRQIWVADGADEAAEIVHAVGHTLGLGDSTGDAGDAMGSYPTQRLNPAQAAALGWDPSVAVVPGAVTTAPSVRIPRVDGGAVWAQGIDGWSGERRVRLWEATTVDGLPGATVVGTVGEAEVRRAPGTTAHVSVVREANAGTAARVVPGGVDVVPPTAPVITGPVPGWVPSSGGEVHWTPSQDAGTGVVGYTLLVDDVPEVTRWADVHSAYAPSRFTVGTDRYVVVAVDAAGNTSASAPVDVRHGDAPGYLHVTATPGDRSAVVTWDPAHLLAPAVLERTVTVEPGGAHHVLAGDATSLTLDGLENLSEYTVTVTARNEVGTSSDRVTVVPEDPDGWIRLLSPERWTVVGSPVRIAWEAGPSVTADVAAYVVSVSGRPLRFVGPDVRAVDLPVEPGHREISVTALDADGDELLVRPAVLSVTVAGPEQPLFADVGLDHRFHRATFWLAQTGVATGYADGSFRPTAPVSRQAMAAFLFRFDVADLGGYRPPSTAPFRDVPTTHPFHREISWLAGTGISAGYADGTFRGETPVSRGAMAAFLYRYAEVTPEEYATPAESAFVDVRPGDDFYREISWLADAGVSGGYDDGTFRPSAPVSRAAMAAFLARFAGEDTWS